MGLICVHRVKKRSVHCLIVTVSDTRTVDTDKSGKLIRELLEQNEHKCVNHVIVPDDMDTIEQIIQQGLINEQVEAILLTGGTGISVRDVTIEVVEKIIEKEIPGFGEIFRMLSYTEDIGSAAMMSRAIAGVKNSKVIIAMPGSSGAVKLAMGKLILPEISHIIYELNKDKI
ncbi:MogA/MoaB family molybdenum cofactor biosynthesis protein [Pseudogracilibacillus sp. SE30717A]|uniref:MogA/MoaB family molybdenum cofactor biosynthesis protein n=1 Tax=Pseudogracilibacillus sp. SE30717A TaxID=3098293 RepID=UPI00300E343C